MRVLDQVQMDQGNGPTLPSSQQTMHTAANLIPQQVYDYHGRMQLEAAQCPT